MTCNQEWSGVVIPGRVNRIVIDQCESCGELRLPDAAPPAQAVDLGAVREAVRKAWQKCAAGESVDLQFGTLLALIDSQAVGNG